MIPTPNQLAFEILEENADIEAAKEEDSTYTTDDGFHEALLDEKILDGGDFVRESIRESQRAALFTILGKKGTIRISDLSSSLTKSDDTGQPENSTAEEILIRNMVIRGIIELTGSQVIARHTDIPSGEKDDLLLEAINIACKSATGKTAIEIDFEYTMPIRDQPKK